MVAVIPGRPVRNGGEAQGTGVEEITDDFAYVSWFCQCSLSSLCGEAHRLWAPNPGAAVLALMESKATSAFIHTPFMLNIRVLNALYFC